MIHRLAEIESSIYTIYDWSKCNFLLQSNEQKEIFGINKSDCKDVNSKMYYDSIHPDDLAFVLETDNMLHDFFSEMTFNERKDYKLVYDFRIRNVEGFYVRYMNQCVVLDQNKNGETWLTLVISHLLSEPDENRKSQRRLINFKTGKLHLFNNNDDDLNSNIILSKREKEILILMSRGYNSTDISDKLHISINTVKNHRQSILRKTKTNNTVQVVFYSKKLGLI